MKILKQGLHPRDRWHTGMCFTCFTEVEFQAKEAERGGEQHNEDMLYIECPVCDNKIWCDVSKYQDHPYSEKPATWKDI